MHCCFESDSGANETENKSDLVVIENNYLALKHENK